MVATFGTALGAVATKDDLANLEQRLNARIENSEQSLKSDMENMEQRLQGEMKNLQQRLVIRLGALIAVGVGVLAALITLV